MIATLASVPLPDTTAPDTGSMHDALQAIVYERHRVEVPIFVFPAHPRRLVRISAQAYNSVAQVELLARALRAEL
jgi:isopenicillin-N epimerase